MKSLPLSHVYINDLPGIFNGATWDMYADDANIIVTGDTFNEAYTKIGKLAQGLIRWVIPTACP